VSDNSFGKVQMGDQVKHNTSGSVCTVNYIDGTYIGVEGDIKSGYVGKDFEWESGVPAFCAGVAASPSLLSVSTISRHALVVSISHSSPHVYHVRSSMFLPTAWTKPRKTASTKPSRG
jgi:hypothetical protein